MPAGAPLFTSYGTAPSGGFPRFIDMTGPTYLKGPKERINDAQKTNYRTLGYLSRGQSMSKILQAGAVIKDNIMLSTTRVTHTYNPGAEESVPNPQKSTTWTVPWRFWITPMTWTRQEIELNGDMTDDARFQQYQSVWHSMQQDGYTDWCNFMEEKFWAIPNKLQMESPDGTEPYSILCFVNEYSSGLPSSIHPGGAWTTVQQIDPTATDKTNWVPQQYTYANVTASDPSNLINALDRAYEGLDFQPPPIQREYFESPTAQPIGFIACSLIGKTKAKALYRSENDRWENVNDPWGQPLYGGRSFVYVAQLDALAAFPTGAGGILSYETDTAGSNNAGPRYFIIQPEYMRMVYHRDAFLYDMGTMKYPNIPTQNVKYLDTWGNLVCRSRRRHAVIYPSADIA